MKKSLLISAALLAGVCIVNAQGQKLSVKPSIGSQAYPILKNLPTELPFPSNVTPLPSTLTPKPSNKINAGKLLGYTYYELQTNCAAGRNVLNHADGTVSFIWTIDDAGDASYTNRGSGYNYWNGSALINPSGTTVRFETIRTGFSQIGILGNGKEVVFAHKGPPYDFQMSTNASKGSNTWTGAAAGATTLLPVPGADPTQGLWGRIATGGSDGNSIHLIAGYFTDAGFGNGIETPATYSRSLDGGQSWNDQSVLLPGYDSTHVLYGGAEFYTVDADGQNVAIVYGGLDADVVLWKSTDNGTNFTRTSVDQYAFEPTFDSTGTTTDTAQTNDGAVTVVVAPNGTAHVAYSVTHLSTDGTTTSFYPTDAELIYWNDVAKNKVSIPISLSDIDGTQNGGNNTGAWEVGQFTAAGGTTPPSARYGNRAFLTIPSIAVDGNNVFILFSLVSDGDSTTDGQSFRDIWIVASADGGVTFGPVQNISCTPSEEEFFGSLAKRVDANLHLLYVLDTEPGTAVQNGDPINATEVRYSTVDKAKVLAGTASCSAGSSVNEHSNSVFSISSNYPNPANGLTFFDVTMKQNASVSFEIFNNIGQQVYTVSDRLSAGKHTLTVDAGTFSSGLYFYTIKSGDAVATGKMIVVGK